MSIKAMRKLVLGAFAMICSLTSMTGCGSSNMVSQTAEGLIPAATAATTDVQPTEEVVVPTTEPVPIPTEQTLVTTDKLPDSWLIDCEPLMQQPELPSGCEITSLTCLLNYLGFPVDKETMADEYLPMALENGTDYTFYERYVGDPHRDGYGCYSPVIIEAASQYLSDQGVLAHHERSDGEISSAAPGGYDANDNLLRVVDLSGSTQQELLKVIASGHPIVIWNTIGSSNVYEELAWTTPDGEDVYWCTLEHCMLLIGYDLTAENVTVCDPLNGIMNYDIMQFFQVYDDMHQQAMTIY